MLAERIERDVLHDDHLAVFDLEAQGVGVGLVLACRQIEHPFKVQLDRLAPPSIGAGDLDQEVHVAAQFDQAGEIAGQHALLLEVGLVDPGEDRGDVRGAVEQIVGDDRVPRPGRDRLGRGIEERPA
mgnify:CR=1 FL=1